MDGYDLIIINFANPDMVGHTGNLKAAIKAVETVDTAVGNVKDMSCMFFESIFDGDISDWDVSNVEDMTSIFYRSNYYGGIYTWNIKKASTYNLYDCDYF